MAILGICFMSCAVLLAGLPPLSGFVAKIAIMTGLLQSTGAAVAGVTWSYMALLIVSGFATLIPMRRAGIRSLVGAEAGAVPGVRLVEMVPVAGLLLVIGVLTLPGPKEGRWE